MKRLGNKSANVSDDVLNLNFNSMSEFVKSCKSNIDPALKNIDLKSFILKKNHNHSSGFLSSKGLVSIFNSKKSEVSSMYIEKSRFKEELKLIQAAQSISEGLSRVSS